MVMGRASAEAADLVTSLRVQSSLVREVRLALVMNGGVSLAVWMGGSTAELHAAATALPKDAPPEPGDSPADLWGKLLNEARLKISVDIVAGTSAGGLNGALLAGCLALGAPYPDMQQEWHDLPMLRRGLLLRKAESRKSGLSILNGGYFSSKVADLFQHEVEDKKDDDKAVDVTCLVTATAIGGSVREIRDDFGSRQRASDHRRVYQFRRQQLHYEYRTDTRTWHPASVNDFTNSGLLAATARASSGFPVAFEPVREEPAMKKQRKVGEGFRTFLMDGGVLDNAAFEPVLDAVRNRPIDGPWVRVLAYLVPSGAEEDLSATEGDPDPLMPGLPQVANGVVGAWRESDSRLDLEAIEEYRRQAGNAATTPEDLLKEVRAPGGPPAWLAAAPGLFELYVATRARAAIRPDPQPPSDIETAGFRSPEAAAREVHAAACDLPFIPASFAAPEDGAWDWGIGTAQRLLRWWARDLNIDCPNPVTLAQLGELQARMQAVAETADKVWSALNTESGVLDEDATEFERLTRLRAWSDNADTRACFEMAGVLVRAGAQLYANALGSSQDQLEADASTALTNALAIEVLLHATLWEDAIPDRPPLKFLRMGPDLVSPVVPPGLPEAHPAWGSRKLYGTTLGHFGAFADGDWRDRDWTWGRLDAAAHLVRLLAAESPVGGSIDVPAWQERIQGAILAADFSDQERWHLSTLRAFENGGITNATVMDRLRRDEASLMALGDEALATMARTGQERPGLVGSTTAFVRAALYLEKPLPPDVDERNIARAVGAPVRYAIRKWIRRES